MPGKIGRRRFLGTAGRIGAGAVLGSLPLINGCKSGPTTPHEPPEPPVPVDLDFTVYNHTQGPRGTFSRTGVMSGTTLEIRVAALITDLGLADVYDKSMVVRESISGTRVGFARGTGVGQILVPRMNTSYEIFLFNIGGKQLYEVFEAFYLASRWKDNIRPQFGTQPRAYRKDFEGFTGEERVWGGEFVPEIGESGVFDQFNKALKPEWASWSYGHIERKPAPNDENGDFGYGFGNCYGRDSISAVPTETYPIHWCGLNPSRIPDVKTQIQHGLNVLSEKVLASSLDFLLGNSLPYIQEDGILKPAYKDYLTYHFWLL